MRLIQNIKRTPANAASLKMAHFSNIGVIEVFLEATPTTFITTFLFISTFKNHGLRYVLIGSHIILFMVGYAVSFLSSAFGVSR